MNFTESEVARVHFADTALYPGRLTSLHGTGDGRHRAGRLHRLRSLHFALSV